MSLGTPLGKVLGLGSAKDGTGHWWAQRITAVALVPLGLWFAVALIGIPGTEYELVHGWIARPVNAILLILLVISVLHHSQLGIQVVVDDYVHVHWIKVPVVIFSKLLHISLAVASIFSVVVIATGSSS